MDTRSNVHFFLPLNARNSRDSANINKDVEEMQGSGPVGKQDDNEDHDEDNRFSGFSLTNEEKKDKLHKLTGKLRWLSDYYYG